MTNVVISHVDNSRFKLLSGLTFNCLQQILTPVIKARYKPQTNLVFPSDRIDHIYLIERGWVKIYTLNEHGQESICAMLGAGESLMIDMLFTSSPSPIGAKTETECDMLVFPVEHLRHMQKIHYEFGLKVLEELSSVSRSHIHLIEQITVQTAIQRVGNFLLMAMLDNRRQPTEQFELPYGKSEIAHYLSLTPATFSRCLKLFVPQGIRVLGRYIHLQSLVALCGYCDSFTATKCRRHCEAGFCRMCTQFPQRKSG